MDWEPIALIAGCYALGCLNAGYYVVRWRTGTDIRTLGTGTAGARNAGRQLGRSGFLVTLLFDVAKGAAAVAIARAVGAGAGWQAVAMLAVVCGHIWPAQLGFRGGKGLATASGAMLVFDLLVVGLAAVLVGILAAMTRQVTASGLAGVASVPVIGVVAGRSAVEVAGLTALAAVVLFAHRANIMQQLSSNRTRQLAPDALSSVPEERQPDGHDRSDIQDSV